MVNLLLNLQAHHINKIKKNKPFQMKHEELIAGSGIVQIPLEVHKSFATRMHRAATMGKGIRISKDIVDAMKNHLHDLGMNVKNAVTDQVLNKSHQLIDNGLKASKNVATSALSRFGINDNQAHNFVNGQIDRLGGIMHERANLSGNRVKRFGRQSVEGGNIANDFKKLGRQIKGAFNPRKIKNTFKEVGHVLAPAVPVLKTIAKKVAPIAIGAMATAASENPMVGIAASKAASSLIGGSIKKGRPAKGSQEMKERMARLRAMKKNKKGSDKMRGNGLFGDLAKSMTKAVVKEAAPALIKAGTDMAIKKMSGGALLPMPRGRRLGPVPNVHVPHSTLLNGVPQLGGSYAGNSYA